MRVLTLWQPWASLIAVGAKTIETRSWSTTYRGPLAIHAAKKWPKMMHVPPLLRGGPLDQRDAHNHQTWMVCDTIQDPAYHGPLPYNPKTGRQKRVPRAAQAPTLFWPHSGPWYRQGKPVERPYKGQAPFYPHSEPLPLGAVVAVCDLVDVVPMVSWTGGLDGPATWAARLRTDDGTTEAILLRDAVNAAESIARVGPLPSSIDITDQLPFGDFTPGRWAWLLDNVHPLTEPYPTKGGQGLRRVPDDIAREIERCAS